jgi:hypothetical protein
MRGRRGRSLASTKLRPMQLSGHCTKVSLITILLIPAVAIAILAEARIMRGPGRDKKLIAIRFAALAAIVVLLALDFFLPLPRW